VVETGKTIVVPRISDEPEFLNHTRSHQSAADKKLSFLCVPIMRGRKVMGTISAERIYDNRWLLDLDAGILSILAGTTAQAVELYLMENVQNAALENENLRLRQVLKTRFKPENIIGNSKPMQDVYHLIEKVIRSRATVLILGESGVGKELVASAIHHNSPNAKGPLIKFNCAALPESVIESELFGHERGAFTGAAALGADVSRTPTAAPFFLTRWANCRRPCRPSSCACCRKKVLSALAAMSRFRLTSAFSPPPIAIC
jgi:Nif-specific regulatory protein